MWLGSWTRARISGQIFRANLPGIELPLPTSLPTARPSLHTRMARNFLKAPPSPFPPGSPGIPRWRAPARRRRSQISGAVRKASGRCAPRPFSGTGSPGSPDRRPAEFCGPGTA
ncbi:hypothetical protein AJOOGB_AJOOGB_12660, partial [Dysosmobacter welbionis]